MPCPQRRAWQQPQRLCSCRALKELRLASAPLRLKTWERWTQEGRSSVQVFQAGSSTHAEKDDLVILVSRNTPHENHLQRLERCPRAFLSSQQRRIVLLWSHYFSLCALAQNILLQLELDPIFQHGPLLNGHLRKSRLVTAAVHSQFSSTPTDCVSSAKTRLLFSACQKTL